MNKHSMIFKALALISKARIINSPSCLLPVIVIFLLPFHLSGQRMVTWKDTTSSELFTEGTYALQVSASVHLISFHDHFEDFNYEEPQPMFFEFKAPADTAFFLKVQERKIVDYYMLESKPGKIKEGINSLGPWSVDSYLKKFNIPSSNLAVLCIVGEEDDQTVLPVNVCRDTLDSVSSNYSAIFRLSKTVREGQFSVYEGKVGEIVDGISALQTGGISKSYGGSTFQVSIDKSNFSDYSGWLTVDIQLTPMSSRTKIPYRFYFYHSADE